MTIKLLARRLYRPGGAEQSFLELKNRLAENDDVEIFGYKKQKQDFLRNRFLPLEFHLFLRYIQSLSFVFRLGRSDTELILSQHELGFAGAIMNRVGFSENIYFVRDYSGIHDTGFDGSNIVNKLVNYVFSNVNQSIFRWICDNSAVLISNSLFMKNYYEEKLEIECEVVYPFIDIDKYRVKQVKPNKILHVGPRKSKGIDTTLKIANNVEEEFIVVGKAESEEIEKKMKELDNLEFKGYVDDMKEVYQESKLIVMPSKWQEPFGRIPVEGGASGIPTVCSDKGGLVEACGDEELAIKGGIENYIQKIETISSNRDYYSNIARKNAEDKDITSQIQKLGSILKNKNINADLEVK